MYVPSPLLALLFTLLVSTLSYAGTATLFWDPPTTNADGTPLGDLAGYKVFIGTSPGQYDRVIDVGPTPTPKSPAYTVNDLLIEGKTYYFVVTAYDTSRNESAPSNQVTKAISALDTKPPTLSGIATGNITGSSVTVSWRTDEPATSQVEYGTTTAYGNSTSPISTLRTDHRQTLTGLIPDTVYHYKVHSSDQTGYLASSPDRTFKTRQSPSSTSNLTNISTRGLVQTGDNVMIAGFIIEGTGNKTVLVKAQGPSLADYGVKGSLTNPTVELFSGSNVIARNDDWRRTDPLCRPPAVSCGDDLDIIATGLDPCLVPGTGCNLESTIYVTLPSGLYAVIVRGSGGNTGVGLVSVYDVDTGNTLAQLSNISTRGFVGTRDNVQIGGFIIEGTDPKTVLIRGRGPSMSGAPFNLSGTVSNPFLQVYSFGNGRYIAQNDDWQNTDPLCGTSALSCGDASDISATGLNPCQPNPDQRSAPPGCVNESAVLITLPPGQYGAIVSGVGKQTGIGLIEVFDID